MRVEGTDRKTLARGLDALEAHPHLRQYDLRSKHGSVARLDTAIGETDAMGAIRDHGGYVTGPFHIEAGSERWHLGFDSSALVDDALSALDRHNEFRVVTRESTERVGLGNLAANAEAATALIEGCRALTPTERRTIEVAVREGYFRSPRVATLADLAGEFGVSKPAVSENLRRAQRKLLGHAVDALCDLDANGGLDANGDPDTNDE
jgi:predicted DNA binding protein